MTESVKYPEITVKLVGEDGNAFAILGKCRMAMKRARCSQEEIDLFYKEATSGDYDHLLQICVKWFNLE